MSAWNSRWPTTSSRDGAVSVTVPLRGSSATRAVPSQAPFLPRATTPAGVLLPAEVAKHFVAYGGMRDHRREGWRHRGSHRCPRCRSSGAWRGARLWDRPRPDRWIGNRTRGPRRSYAEGDSRRMVAARGRAAVEDRPGRRSTPPVLPWRCESWLDAEPSAEMPVTPYYEPSPRALDARAQTD